MKYFLISITACLVLVSGFDKNSGNVQGKFDRSFMFHLKEEQRKGAFRFSQDGRKFSFVFKDGDNYRVMWNNTPGEPFDEIGDVELSQTGLHLMYWGFKGSRVFLLMDHKVIGSWPAKSKDDLSRYWSIIGPKDHHWVAGEFSEGMLNWRLVDGKEQPKLAAHGPVLFSKNGRSWGYIGHNKEKGLVYIVNGKEILSIPNCSNAMVNFSLVSMIIDDEGNIIAAVEPTVGGYQVRYRKKIIAKFGESLYAEGNSLLGFVGIQPKEKEEKMPIKISERYIYSKSLQYNAGHLAWVQNVEGTVMGDSVHEVVLDGKPIGVKIYAGGNMWLNKVVPVFSPGGDALAFEGRDENQHWFVWSEKGISARYECALQPQWSPNGNRLAFTAWDNKDGKERQFYVVDGEELYGYENPYVGRFSPDSRFFCFVGKKNDKLVLVMDGNEFASFDEVIAVTPSVTQDSDILWYIVREGTALYRYELV